MNGLTIIDRVRGLLSPREPDVVRQAKLERERSDRESRAWDKTEEELRERLVFPLESVRLGIREQH